MAAYRPAVTLSILCCLFLLAPFSSASKIILPSNSHKVSLALYYESLCPYSANFIVNYLPKLFEDDLISIVDLRLVPWGNARLKGNDTFACQHGPGECLLNTVEACAIDAWPQLNDHFLFIYCVEALVFERKYLEWESCFEKLGLDSKPISDCYSSGLGQKDYENYISYVCKAYKGAALPKACSGLSFNQIYEKKFIHPVCYKELPALTLSSRTISTVMSWIQQMATSM